MHDSRLTHGRAFRGWKLVATGEVQYDISRQQLHWLLQLERISSLVGGLSVETQLRDSAGPPTPEENNHAEWFEDAILATLPSPGLLEQFLPGLDAASPLRRGSQDLMGLVAEGRSLELEMPLRQSAKGLNSPVSAFKDPGQLLKQLVRSPLGPNAQTLVQIMKGHVIEDRGQLPIINQAVYAAAAAMILHNNLAAEAMALVMQTLNAPSAALIKTWRAAQKMRQWLAFSDAAAAQAVYDVLEHGPHHRRRPSLYSGTSEEVLEKVCRGAINRAKWLLCIVPFDEEVPVQLKPRSRSRSRCVSADLTSTWVPPGAIDDGSQDLGTSGSSAAHELKQLLEFRRALSERRKRKKTTTELVLGFLQSDTIVEDLVKVMKVRNERCTKRCIGLNLARSLLVSLRSDDSKMEVLRATVRGIRSLALPHLSLGERVHFMNRLNGASDAKKQEVTRAFTALMSQVIALLQECSLSSFASAGICRLALQICAVDYEPEDHELLHDSRLLPQIHTLMSSPDEDLRRTALALYKLLLRRCIGPGTATLPVASIFQHDLLNVLKYELQSVIPGNESRAPLASRQSPTQVDQEDEEEEGEGEVRTEDRMSSRSGTRHRCLVAEPMEIGRQLLGQTAAHFPLGPTHTIAFWLWRRTVEHRPSHAKHRYKVVGTEGCLVRATPNLDSDVVVTLETGTIVEVGDPEPEYADHPLIRNGRRVRICLPVSGYGSRHASQGYQILRQEAEARPGDRVCRGPDWRTGDQDGGEGQIGTVVGLTNWENAENRGIRVRWDHDQANVHTYRWGYLGKYDVVVTHKDESGVLILKGNDSLLTTEEASGTWTSYGVALRDDASLEHFIAAGNETIRLEGKRKVPPDEWTHVAIVQSKSDVKLYVDGRQDQELKLPKHLLRPGRPLFKTVTRQVETPHPYPDNMDEYWWVSIPGATRIRITFDSQTKTEPEFDYVKIYKDASHTETWGLDKYHGGRSGSAGNWPGVQQPPLDIPASSFVVYFHSDGSNNDWGFSLSAEGVCAVYEEPTGDEPESADLNAFPWYFGQPPFRVTSRRTIDRGWMAGVHVFNEALSERRLVKLMHSTAPSVMPPQPYPDGKTVEMLAMVSRCCLTPIGKSTFSAEPMVSLLLRLVGSAPPRIRLAALRLCQSIFPLVGHKLLDSYVHKISGQSPEPQGFARVFLADIGKTLNVLGHYLEQAHYGKAERPREPRCTLAAQEKAGLALSQVSLLMNLAEISPVWADHVFSIIHGLLTSVPALVDSLLAIANSANSQTHDSASPRNSKVDVDQLDLVVGVLALLGGTFATAHFGGRVQYRVPNGPAGGLTEVEEGTVLSVNIFNDPNKNASGPGKDALQDPDWPEETLTILPRDQSEIVEVKACDAMPLTRSPPASIVAQLIKAAPEFLTALKAILTAGEQLKVPNAATPEALQSLYGPAMAVACLNDLRARLMRSLSCLFQNEDFIVAYLPLIREISSHALSSPPAIPVEPAKKRRVFESKHPYENNTKQTFEVTVRGAVKLNIEFDPQSRTETGCDYLVFYKDRSKRERWGMDKYSGRDNWPGCGGRPPLEIPASSFVVYWYTDGSNYDWGWRFTVTATMAQIDVNTAPVSQLEQRLYSIGEILQELPACGATFTVEDLAGLGQLLAEEDEEVTAEASSAVETEVVASPGKGSRRSSDATPPRGVLNYQAWPQKFRVIEETVDLYTEPTGRSQVVARLQQGVLVEALGQRGNWIEVENDPIYVCPAAKVPLSTADFLSNLAQSDAVSPAFCWDTQTPHAEDFAFTDLSEEGRTIHRVVKVGLPDVSIVLGDQQLSAGRWYWEIFIEKLGDEMWVGITDDPDIVSLYHESGTSIRLNRNCWSYSDGHRGKGFECAGRRLEALPDQYREGDTLGFFLDISAGTLAIYKNGRLQGTHVALPRDGTTFWPFAALDYAHDAVVLRRTIRLPDSGAQEALPPRLWTLLHAEDKMYLEAAQRLGASQNASWIVLSSGSEAEEELEDPVDSLVEPTEVDHEEPSPSARTPSTGTAAPGSTSEDVELDQAREGPGKRDIAEYSVRHDLRGQTGRLLSFSMKSCQASTIRFASQILLTIVAKWPKGTPFSIDIFGSFQRFWKFLFLTYSIENSGLDAPKVSCRGLLDKLCDAVPPKFMQQLLQKSVSELKRAVDNVPMGMAVTKVLETPHPYLDNMDTEWVISIPGAKRLKIVFDSRSKTETNCDWLIFYKDSTRSVKYGERYHGRNGSENFPGFGRRPPLWIDSDSCVAHFHSDGSTVDWGVRFTVYGILVDDGSPGTRPGDGSLIPSKELDTQISMSCWLLEAFFRETSDVISQVIYGSATLEVIRYCIMLVTRRRRIRLLHLVMSMMQDITRVRDLDDLTELVRSLRSLIYDQYEQERSYARKSTYLQALVQCLVSIRSAVLKRIQETTTGPAGSPTRLRPGLRPQFLAPDSPLPGSSSGPTRSLAWVDAQNKRALPSSADGTFVVHNPSSNTITARTEHPVVPPPSSRTGVPRYACWDIVLSEFSPKSAVGLWQQPLPGSTLESSDLGIWVSESCLWLSLDVGADHVYTARLDLRAELGPGLSPVLDQGDVIRLTVDPITLAVDASRNGVPIGRLSGPEDLQPQPALPFPSPADGITLVFHPALILEPGDRAVVMPRPNHRMSSTTLVELLRSPIIGDGQERDKAKALEKAAGGKSATPPNDQAWFTDVCTAVEMLSEFATNRTPLGLLLSDFKPHLVASETVVIQSAHPFDNKPSLRQVTIPDAESLEVRLDDVTQMHDQDEILIRSEEQPQGHCLLGPGAPSDGSPANPPPVKAGDFVVRGRDWKYADEDGGPGARGTVTKVEKGPDQGVQVRWPNGVEGLYAAGEVRVLERCISAVRPNVTMVRGDTVHMEVRPGLSGVETTDVFTGSLGFSPASSSHVEIPAYSDLDLDSDFTIEVWARLNTGASRNGRLKCIASKVMGDLSALSALSEIAMTFLLSPLGAPTMDLPSGLPVEEVKGGEWVDDDGAEENKGEASAGDDAGRDEPGAASGGDGRDVFPGSASSASFLRDGRPSSRRETRPLLWGHRGGDGHEEDIEDDQSEEDEEEGTAGRTGGVTRRIAGLWRMQQQQSLVTEQTVDSESMQQLLLMGFEESVVRNSLIAARNDLMQAIEYCMSGVPNERLLNGRVADLVRSQHNSRQRSRPGSEEDSVELNRRVVTEANVQLGARVVRGRHWHYDDQDGHTTGVIIGWYKTDRQRAPSSGGIIADNPIAPGWARVRWDNGNVLSYEIGAQGLYALNFASSPPGPVRGLAHALKPGDGVKLSWKAPADVGTPALAGYQIHRDGACVHTIESPTASTYLDKDIRPGSTHSYIVVPFNSAGPGARCQPVEAYIPCVHDKLTVMKLFVDGQGQLRFVYGHSPSMIALDGGTVEEDRWFHVAITAEGNSFKLLVDGVQKDSRMFTGPRLFSREKPTFLGALGAGADYWDGWLYDARFWASARSGATLRKFSTNLPTRCNAFLGQLSASSYKVVNKSVQRFPSIRINAPVAGAGKLYYEATIRSSGCIQIGWALPQFSPTTFFMGVGDDDKSWACDGLRQMKWHGVSPPVQANSTQYSHGLPYGKDWTWAPGDTVGCLLDLDEGVMRFSHNGRDLGVAFRRHHHLAGRYRVTWPEGVPCYHALQEDAEVTMTLTTGAVFSVSQTEVSEDGLLWLKVKDGWVPQRSAKVAGRFYVEKLRRVGLMPTQGGGWRVGPEQCIHIDRFAAASRAGLGNARGEMAVSERGLHPKQGSDKPCKLVLTQMLEVEASGMAGVTVFLDLTQMVRKGPQALEGREDDAYAGLVLDDCEILVYPYLNPPKLTVRCHGLTTDTEMVNRLATTGEDAEVRLVVNVRRSGNGYVRVLFPKTGSPSVDASFYLPNFFHNERLGSVGVTVKSEGALPANDPPPPPHRLSFRTLAIFLGDHADLPGFHRLSELDAEYQAMIARRQSEPAEGPLALPAARAELVWVDRGGHFRVWAPELSPNQVYFGHTVSPDDAPPEMLISVEHPGLVAPASFQRLWSTPAGPTQQLTAWLPKPPSDSYVALGVLFTSDVHPPHAGAVRCLHKSHARQVNLEGQSTLGLPEGALDGAFSVVPGLRTLVFNGEDCDGTGFTFLPSDSDEAPQLRAFEDADRGLWDGIMPAMSCSEQEGLDFNIGQEQFKHCPPQYAPLLEGVQEAATLALQIFNVERSGWENVNGNHGVMNMSKEEDRLVGRFILNDGDGSVAHNAVYCRRERRPNYFFPAASIHGCEWSSQQSPLEQFTDVWGYKLMVSPCFPADVQNVERLRERFMRYVAAQNISPRSGSLDTHIVRYVNFVSRKRNISKTALLSSAWAALTPRAEELVAWPVLAQAMTWDHSDPTSTFTPTKKRQVPASGRPRHGEWVDLDDVDVGMPPEVQDATDAEGGGAESKAGAAEGSTDDESSSVWVVVTAEMLPKGGEAMPSPGVDVKSNPTSLSRTVVRAAVGSRMRVLGYQTRSGDQWAHVELFGGLRGYVRLPSSGQAGAGWREADYAELYAVGRDGPATLVGQSKPGRAGEGNSLAMRTAGEREKASPADWVAVGDREAPYVNEAGDVRYPAAPCSLMVSTLDYPPSEAGQGHGIGLQALQMGPRPAVVISGQWTIGISTDLLGVVTRTTGYIRSKDVGLADGVACCLRGVDGSIQILIPTFQAGRESYPSADPKECVAYMGAELETGTRVAFEVVDDGYYITFTAREVGDRGLSARLRVACAADSGRGRVAIMRLAEDGSDGDRGWLRVVSDDRGATLRDGVSIDEATQVGRLARGQVVRYSARATYESPGMGEYCDTVVRYHVAATPISPAGWISERGRYSRQPYRIAERVLPPIEDTPACLTHLSVGIVQVDGSEVEAAVQGGGFQPERLAARFKVLRNFNSLMLSTISFVDLSLVGRPGSIASLVSASRHLIFSELKMELWEAALDKTATDNSSLELVLSRSLAARHRSTGRPDVEAKYTIFSQAFRQLRSLPPSAFRLKPGAVMYHTILRGEMAHDAGGPYRETFAMYCDDLQSSSMNLFLRCSNSVNNVGTNREKWVPNPSARAPLELEMYEFLGRLMGMAIRTRQCLDLNFPSILWKQLVGSPILREDLEAIDIMLIQSMDSVRNIDKQGITEQMFQDVIMETFTTISTDDRAVELKAGGVNIPVTFQNREEYADLVEQYRMREFVFQVGSRMSLAINIYYSHKWRPTFLISSRVCESLCVKSHHQPERIRFSLGRATGDPSPPCNRGSFMAKEILQMMILTHVPPAQVEAIRRGVAQVVPQQLLTLFTWDELEVFVCGNPEVDVELLESCTEYNSCGRNDRHVRFFWEVLRWVPAFIMGPALGAVSMGRMLPLVTGVQSRIGVCEWVALAHGRGVCRDFTSEERSLFIRFTWGRSRLPVRLVR
jgi:hypothetical protein